MSKFLVSKNTIVLILLYFTQFVWIAYLRSYSIFRYACILVIAIYLFPKFKSFFQYKYRAINMIMIVLSLITIIGSYVNEDLITTRNSFLASLSYFVTLLETFFFFEYTAEKGEIQKAVNIFYRLTLIVATVTDILILWIGDMDNVYLVGSKFQVAYLHLFLIALFWAKAKMNEENPSRYRIIALLYFALAIIVSLLVDCNTGLIGTIVFLVLYLLAKRRKAWLYSPITYALVFLLSFLFVFLYEFILSNVYVQDFVINVLHRSLTLTGRTDIYPLLLSVMRKRIWFGYGYGTTYDISVRYFGYADTQNALSEWIIQIGVIGVAFIFLLLFNIFKKAKKENLSSRWNYSLILYIYVLTILGTVEISFGRLMFGVLALLYASTFTDTSDMEKAKKIGESQYEVY